MIDITEKLASSPRQIAIIGGGRWARVFADVVCDLVPEAVEVSAHSPGHAGAMAEWAKTRPAGRRISVSAKMPDFLDPASSVVLVVNAAADHAAAAEFAIARCIPVLMEKPIAPTAPEARHLASLARNSNVRLAAAQVFLFARYLEHFAAAVAASGPLQSLSMDWADPEGEERHGERKRYDPRLAIYADLLPHVVSIFGAVARRLPDRCEGLKIERGGAAVEMRLLLGDVACGVRLERESSGRRRLLHAAVAGGRELVLDFSSEPGTITNGGTDSNGDPRWDDPAARRPVASMLAAFLSWAAGGKADPRLSLEPGLRACELADAAGRMLRAG